MWKKLFVALFACLALGPAFATLTFTFTESGGNVELAVGGSVNTTALTLSASGITCSLTAFASVAPSNGITSCGTGGGNARQYTGLVGPANFGSGSGAITFTVNGSVVQLQNSGQLFLPDGYVSGTPLSASATFNGTTFLGMGLVPGTYTWTFGSGPSADTVVVQIGSVVPPGTVSSIPTLGEFALMALAGLVFLSTLPALRRKS